MAKKYNVFAECVTILAGKLGDTVATSIKQQKSVDVIYFKPAEWIQRNGPTRTEVLVQMREKLCDDLLTVQMRKIGEQYTKFQENWKAMFYSG